MPHIGHQINQPDPHPVIPGVITFQASDDERGRTALLAILHAEKVAGNISEWKERLRTMTKHMDLPDDVSEVLMEIQGEMAECLDLLGWE